MNRERLLELGLDETQADTLLDEIRGEVDGAVNAVRLDHAVSAALRASGAKNETAVRAFLDQQKILLKNGVLTGLEDQISALKNGKDTAFLFGGDTLTLPGEAGAVPDEATGGEKEYPSDYAGMTYEEIASLMDGE